MSKQYVILFLSIILVACAGTKKTVTVAKQQVKTFTITDEIKLDTTIFIQKSHSQIAIPIKHFLKTDSIIPRVITKKNGRSTVTVKIDSTGIIATSDCDSIAKEVSFYKKQVKELKVELNQMKVEKSQKKGFSRLELILYMIAAAVTAFAAAYLLKTFKIL